VEFDLTTDLGLTRLDGPQFESALLNLVINARDAMPDGGRVRMTTAIAEIGAERAGTMSGIQPGRYVALTVADAGTGMTPAVRERAFEPFYTTKDTGKGSGLGLSQVYGFTVQSGGHVALESVEGQGTSVTMYLPISAHDEAADASNEAQALRGTSVGTVLIVEDDPDVLDSAVSTLRSLGYDVLTAGDGESALSTLRREQHVDVLFSDVVMPRGMSGVELARRACGLRPDLKVLLASGYPMSSLSTEHSFNDQFSFLSKPYRWTELQDKLRAMGAG
jgi:CheY-like chemotaxis protein